MSNLLIEVDAWVMALLLALAMLAAWGVGWWKGRRQARSGVSEPVSKLSDASLALLGLLLAFTFSMSLAKHEQRRQMVVTDSNSIGDFYTTASLTAEPVRRQLQDVIRQYTELRLSVAEERLDESAFQKKEDEMQEMQQRMQTLVSQAVDGGTPVLIPLVNTLNELTSSHAARLAAGRNRLPASIVMLLFLVTVVSLALVGKQEGISGERHIGATVAFVVLVSMAVGVTLDLNQPKRGLITVSLEPMKQLLSGMKR